MLDQFFKALETTVNQTWRWFYVQEAKFSAYNFFWPWFAHQERKLIGFWSWLVARHKMVSFVLIWLGLNTLIIQGLYANYRSKILSFQVTPVTQESAYRATLPIKLVIGSVQLNLPIIEASIVDNVWQMSDDSVTHLESSARPGESGNIVMYGHNRWNILSALHQVKLGSEIVIETGSSVKHTYVVENIHIVSPSEVQYVLPTPEEQLTVYTCTGFFDSQRLVVIAKPSSVSSL